MANKLFIVGLPIGNLKDITLRALEVLKKVKIIACEDTRVTHILLKHYEITEKKLISYNDNNEKNSAQGILKLLSHEDVVLVSDAGMPVVNDPGYEIIRECIKNNILIEVIPGPSAVLTTLVLSNFDTHFTFIGFMKPKNIQRQNQLKTLIPGTYIAFISPHKLMESLEDIKLVLGEETKVFLGRELTKLYESHYRGNIKDVIEMVKDHIKGEFTIAIEIKKSKKNKYAK